MKFRAAKNYCILSLFELVFTSLKDKKILGGKQMLDVMRKHAQSWLIKGVFAIIIVVFILFWTEPGQKGVGLEVVATVDGSKITLSEYRRSYENLLNIYRSVYREGLSEDIIKMLKLKEKALDTIIDSRLLLKEADNLGLRNLRPGVRLALDEIGVRLPRLAAGRRRLRLRRLDEGVGFHGHRRYRARTRRDAGVVVAVSSRGHVQQWADAAQFAVAPLQRPW